MKRFAALALLLALCLAAGGAQAFTMTGLETETVERNWAGNAFFARMEALTGIGVSPHGVTDTNEYQNLLEGMKAGEVHVDALFKANLSREQETELLDCGALIDLAPLIDAHMPNLSALLTANPAWKDVIALEDGRIASLPLINERERQCCIWINRAWLDQLGVAMPQTLEELTAALMAMREGDPNQNAKKDEVPADLIGVYEMRWLLPYVGIVADDYNLARNADGEIVFAPELAPYRDFIALLKEWYDLGLLNEEAFTTTHSTLALNAVDEDAPVVSGMLLSVTPYTHVPAEMVENYEALLLPAADGSVRWRDMLGAVWTGCFAVTSACEDPAQALAWADALYGETGALLAYAGVEGEDYVITDEGYWAMKLDNGRTVNDLRSDVLMYTGAAMPGRYPAAFIYNVDSPVDRHVFDNSERVRAVSERVTPPYCLGAQDQARADELSTVLGGLVDRGIARFVTGEIEFSDENYDAWLKEMREAGSGELAALFAGVK